MEKNSNLIGLVILAGLFILIIASPREMWLSSPLSSGNNNSSFNSSDPIIGGSTITSSPRPQNVNIAIGPGNASYAFQPYEEYITIDNFGDSAVDLTGWQLRNGLDKRPYNNGGTLQRFSASIAVLPHLILNRGERAVITTGRVGVQEPYRINNFKENMCTGYLEALPNYAFTPPLTQNCPRPNNEPGLVNLDVECRDFISTLSSCKTPEFGSRDEDGEYCENCINGKLLSNSCRAFIKERFNYQGCLANHSNDTYFAGNTWRIFLGRGWEMWAEKYETIELFNTRGQLVNFYNY